MWKMSNFLKNLLGTSFAVFVLTSRAAMADEPLGIGKPVSKSEISGWDIDARPDGHGLPKGSGSVEKGEAIYMEQCAACHGEFGEGVGRFPVLMGGYGTLTSSDPNKTVGSYWPYATTLFDYIRRAMPYGNAQSLSTDEVYSVSAYVLFINDILKKEATLNAKSLATVKMPNRNGFISLDPRPDIKKAACMKDCKTEIIIKSFARKIAVTPEIKKDKLN
jgi:cytochrome c